MNLIEIEKMASTALQNGRYDVSAALYLGLYETIKVQMQNASSFPRYLSNPKEWESCKWNLISTLNDVFDEKIDTEKLVNDVWHSIVNPPLEVNELWEMGNKPVWVYSIPDKMGSWKVLNIMRLAHIWWIEKEYNLDRRIFNHLKLSEKNYGIDWVAYRYPLEVSK